MKPSDPEYETPTRVKTQATIIAVTVLTSTLVCLMLYYLFVPAAWLAPRFPLIASLLVFLYTLIFLDDHDVIDLRRR